MIVSVERDGVQLASVTSFNSAAGGNEIERNIRSHKFPISANDIIGGLRDSKVALGLQGAKVYFKSKYQMRFGRAHKI